MLRAYTTECRLNYATRVRTIRITYLATDATLQLRIERHLMLVVQQQCSNTSVAYMHHLFRLSSYTRDAPLATLSVDRPATLLGHTFVAPGATL